MPRETHVPDLTDLDVLNALAADPLLEQISKHVPSLSFFHLLGSTRDEVTHSRVIATIFDPRRHRQAEVGLRAFVACIQRELEEASLEQQLARILSARWTTVRVRREQYRLDITVEICSPAGNAVIGIENKIDAGEGHQQLARYQASLDIGYPHHTALIAFLAPTKRCPSTLDAASRVPCVPLDYSAVVEAIHASLAQAEPGSTDAVVLRELASHLVEEILEDREVRAVAHQLWKAHGRALELAFEHRPRLSDVVDAYEGYLREHFDDELNFTYYPSSRGEVREIMLVLPAWDDAELPFTFDFRVYEGMPYLRLLLWHECYDESVSDWARRVNPALGGCLDEALTPVKGWSAWRRVFKEVDHPPETMLEACWFNDDTAREAADRVISIAAMLQPHIAPGGRASP